MNSQTENNFHARAHKFIPAGAHTYSRADYQFPANAPKFVKHAKDAYFWDDKDNRYLDYGMGLLSVSIGHANSYINERVIKAIENGTSFSRPSLLEGELAEKLNAVIPSAEMVKFAKNGSDVTSAAIRLARAYTKRKLIVRCKQQPFLSFNDWFIASTSRSGGIPDEMKSWVKGFNYNSISSLEKLFAEYSGQIACIIMEPFSYELPKDDFLNKVKSLCEKEGSLLIFDEIICGFRTAIAGGQSIYNVTPHLSTFGKGLGNGYPISVLCGQKEIMRQGGMEEDVFLLSCTFGGETIGLTAASACLDFMQEHSVPVSISKYGQALMNYFNALIDKHQLQEFISVSGHPARLELRFMKEGKPYYALKTLFIQKMLEHSIFMERIAISYTHGPNELQSTCNALDVVIPFLEKCIKDETIESQINGKIIVPVFTY